MVFPTFPTKSAKASKSGRIGRTTLKSPTFPTNDDAGRKIPKNTS